MKLLGFHRHVPKLKAASGHHHHWFGDFSGEQFHHFMAKFVAWAILILILLLA